jgi:guanosine-3',5'-bis(diphosphate) 3'-pyrophosphohydrolase
MNRIYRAEKFAKLKHKGQKRKDGKTPYWHHLSQVVKNLKEIGIKNTDVLCAGWLHDTIEDTTTDYDELAEKFGKKVADIVSQLTKDKRLPRKGRESDYIKQLTKASLEAKIVKFCDIAANISDLENSGYTYQKKARQVEDKLRYLSAIKLQIFSNRSGLPRLGMLVEELNSYCKKFNLNAIS